MYDLDDIHSSELRWQLYYGRLVYTTNSIINVIFLGVFIKTANGSKFKFILMLTALLNTFYSL